MSRIVFIAKTNLNNDGRILNELEILKQSFEDVSIDFILLPDKPLEIELATDVNIITVNLRVRHNKFLRFLSVIEFTAKTLFLLFKLKPKVIHVQDADVVLPVIIYRFIKVKRFTLIYDDHEIPNENEPLQNKLLSLLEVYLMKHSDHVIFANEERMQILRQKYHLKNKTSYLLNLPYFDEEKDVLFQDKVAELKLLELDSLRAEGIKFIIHQGVLVKERGKEKIANFALLMPENIKIMLLGGSKKDFDTFLLEYNLNKNRFFFVGSVNYLILPKFWERAMASIVIYLPTYLNNRYCAPNRFYISVKKNIPVIVNKNNPVLNNFITKYKCGVFIEDLLSSEDVSKLSNFPTSFKIRFFELMKKQKEDFISIYQNL